MKICVIGTGTMAKGIVKAFAAKMPVVMKSRTQASLDKAMASIAKGYGKLVEKGKMTQEAVDALLKNITTTTDYATFADADLVIEAAVEEMQLKKDVCPRPSLPPTRHRCRSPRSLPARAVPPNSSACTSSTPPTVWPSLKSSKAN